MTQQDENAGVTFEMKPYRSASDASTLRNPIIPSDRVSQRANSRESRNRTLRKCAACYGYAENRERARSAYISCALDPIVNKSSDRLSLVGVM